MPEMISPKTPIFKMVVTVNHYGEIAGNIKVKEVFNQDQRTELEKIMNQIMAICEARVNKAFEEKLK